MKRGAIRVEEAYAQGKMLESSSWVLPRNITPSDIDLVFDDGVNEVVVFCEFSSQVTNWTDVAYGQFLLYQAVIRDSANLACLCKHSVPTSSVIDTKNDVDSFQVMFCSEGWYYVSPEYPGRWWGDFVERVFNGDKLDKMRASSRKLPRVTGASDGKDSD